MCFGGDNDENIPAAAPCEMNRTHMTAVNGDFRAVLFIRTLSRNSIFLFYLYSTTILNPLIRYPDAYLGSVCFITDFHRCSLSSLQIITAAAWSTLPDIFNFQSFPGISHMSSVGYSVTKYAF